MNLTVITLAGQSGAASLEQVLTGDVSMGDVLDASERLTGLGISATDAGVIIAVLVFGMKVVDANKGLFVTLNDWLRQALKLEPRSHPGRPDAR